MEGQRGLDKVRDGVREVIGGDVADRQRTVRILQVGPRGELAEEARETNAPLPASTYGDVTQKKQDGMDI